ncbi:MAG: hypothetical protein HF962_01920 [Sulfurovum sp.]|nr:hypothetical protein [Sulfurovum sp.]
MKSFFLLLFPIIIISLSGCAPKYDYRIHKPKVKYKKPSKDALARTLKEKLGSKYVWAEEGPRSFDCSGLTYYSYGRMNMEIPRVSREQAKVGKTVALDQLKYGDLLFFDTAKKRTGKVNHVGIYIGDGKFQHASSSTEGVIITDVNSSYYKKRVVVCKRYLPDGPSNATVPKLTIPKPIIPDQPYMVAQATDTSTITPLGIEEQTIQKHASNTPSKAIHSTGKHYIQVGTFANEPSKALFRQILSNGYQYKVLQVNSAKKVLIGPYVTKTQASQELDNIRATILPDAFAMKI